MSYNNTTKDRLCISGGTNKAMRGEGPTKSQSYILPDTLSISGKTNKTMRGEGPTKSQSYILADKLNRGGFDGKPGIPSVSMNHMRKQLIRVR